MWRGILYGLIISLAVGFLFGILAVVFGITEQAKPYYKLIGMITGIPVGIWVLKIALEKQYSDFQIILTASFEKMLDEKQNPVHAQPKLEQT